MTWCIVKSNKYAFFSNQLIPLHSPPPPPPILYPLLYNDFQVSNGKHLISISPSLIEPYKCPTTVVILLIRCFKEETRFAFQKRNYLTHPDQNEITTTATTQ